MPTAAQRPCAAPGCSVLVTSGRCQRHAQQREQQRGKVAARGYGYRWQKARTAYLALNPLCVVCQRAASCALQPMSITSFLTAAMLH